MTQTEPPVTVAPAPGEPPSDRATGRGRRRTSSSPPSRSRSSSSLSGACSAAKGHPWEGSRLADDVASADVVVLASAWQVWDEPNASQHFGSDAPNQVLREEFCSVGTYGGLYELLECCERS